MIVIDCKEMSTDEEIALASTISDGLEGVALGLIRNGEIVIDPFPGSEPDYNRVLEIVRGFVSRRKRPEDYGIEEDGETITVHPPVPLPRKRVRNPQVLPPNLLKCPYCAFVTPYEEMYVVHTRAHVPP
ncbi:MAG: hypothetical protein HY296_00540 [Thaumarchaeota archaeon]|nr:hypothetical protein [Nitrososphaerota archaeon]